MWIAVVYAAGLLVLTVFGCNLLVLSVALVRAERQLPGFPPDPDATPEPGPDWPPLTVQLPLYNERFVAERLIDACARLDYTRGRLEIQVLDDSTDDTSALVARSVATWRVRGVDVSHIKRSDRTGFKAGALQNGLTLARGELIAILDADFIPEPDFLRQLVPALLDDPELGLVQARWGHQNQQDSLLTRVQAFGLDTHFALEQRVRDLTGCFLNFNGTAGIWRRACIEEAGGWEGDTLTEDLDLSYRAQLAGWRFRYLHDVEVPAELPSDMNGFRSQQFRWTKGAVQTARKLLPTLLRSTASLRVKAEGVVHLTAHMAYPFVLIAALLHAPLVWLKHSGQGPGEAYFAAMGFGLLGFLGFFLANLFAQRSLYPDWLARLGMIPVFMAGSMGMAPANTRAVVEGLLGRESPFVRTPKMAVNQAAADRSPERDSPPATEYVDRRIPPVAWVEAALAVYSLVGLGFVVYAGEWAAMPFQILFAAGFGLVAVFSFREVGG